jgi:hypothetical protein
MPHHERLHIKNFGPIREADIEVRDITVFIGQQATGKSLTAQLLYFMRGMEELVVSDAWGGGRIPGSGFITHQEMPGKLTGLLANWLGNGSTWHKRTLIDWSLIDGDTQREDRVETVNIDTQGGITLNSVTLNSTTLRRVEQLFGPTPSQCPINEKQIYIPAGRIIYSFLEPQLTQHLLSEKKQELHWPGYINVFCAKLKTALRSLESAKRLGDEADKFCSQVLGGTPLISGEKLFFSTWDKFMKEDGYDSKIYAFDQLKLASGQMEQWPFWVLAATALQEKDTVFRLFFEEPEAHLHPTAQIALIEAIARLARKNLRFVITTHSPYVVYALNNFLMAQQILDAGGKLPASAAVDTALRHTQVSAYRFTPDGTAESLLRTETGLIDTKDLDDPAGRLNATFGDMLDVMYELENKR